MVGKALAAQLVTMAAVACRPAGLSGRVHFFLGYCRIAHQASIIIYIHSPKTRTTTISKQQPEEEQQQEEEQQEEQQGEQEEEQQEEPKKMKKNMKKK